ncbi:MAG: phosphoribosylamine--glycine ligase [Deltaproteobacteria bacterium HGW-Deltaproteobacteria-14]|jgi:phosphoribosylamine--glycine ligase|nr:MAG: phosphoribosylamine--glycine ligase [Deltaproteobacteria bacterium HGW-Deltaproteobacteria-14]
MASEGAGARVMIIGGGGRSHALGEALRQSPSVAQVVFAPGTSGLEWLGYETAPVASQDLPGLVEHALMEEFDLSVVGPNTPLVDGIVDRFEAAGLPIFGPTRAAARIEGSKAHARLLMGRLGVPTPRFAVCDTVDRAHHLAMTRSWARVFKADGIAYDKGVRVTMRADEAEQALHDVMYDNVYGLESDRVVVEERIDGVEVTVFTLCDGRHLEVLGHVLNYPRLRDGDAGPPSRGMGQVSPAPMVDDAMVADIVARALQPVVDDLAADGIPLRGALFVDLMLSHGAPYVIDYNVRFGDPATQTMLSAYTGDFYAVLQACRTGVGLREAVAALTRDTRPRVSVVAVCEGYPQKMVRGARVELDAALFRDDPDLWLFLDGVRFVAGEGLYTTGGRTVSVVAAAGTVAEAAARAYAALDAGVRFAGMHVRRDIGRGFS